MDGPISKTLQDSLTVLEYLRLDEKLNSKIPTETIIAHIATLCEKVASFSENTLEER